MRFFLFTIDSTNAVPQAANSKNLSNSFSAIGDKKPEPTTGRSYVKHITKDLIRDIL